MAQKDYVKYHDGAETLDLIRLETSTGAPTVDTSNTRFSRGAYKFNAVEDLRYRVAGLTAQGQWDTVTQYNHLALTFAFKYEPLPTVSFNDIIEVYDSSLGVNRMAVQVNTDGSVRFAVDNGADGVTSAAGLIVAGQWYVLTVIYQRNGACTLIIRNADSGATVVSLTRTENSNGTVVYIYLGAHFSINGATVYIDNIVWEADNTFANLGDPVDFLTVRYACGLLVPDATGFYDAWNNTWANLDDTPNDGDATTRAIAANGAFTNNLKATSSLVAQVGSAHSTIAYTYVRNTGGSADNVLRLRSGATDNNTTLIGIGWTTYATLQKRHQNDPATASAWTVSGLDSAEVGMSRTAGTFTTQTTVVGLEILYTVGAIKRTRRIEYFLESYDPLKRIIGFLGREVLYNEVRSNRWLRLLRKGLPTVQEEASFFDMEDMFYLEGVVYEQQWGQDPRIQLKGPDDFTADLIEKIGRSAGGGI
jgi:hypothetical protein